MSVRRRAYLGVIFAVLLIGFGESLAAELPRAEPQALGFSAERLNYIDQFCGDEVKRGDLAGAVILIARHGRVAHFSALGYADVEKKQAMATDTIFRLYSMTKPITATALMMLYEEGRFQLQDPLAKYLPEFSNLRVLRDPDGAPSDTLPVEHEPTIQDVLRHTAGFTHGLESNAFDAQYTQANLFGIDVTLSEMMGKLAKLPLRYPPGTKFVYSVGPDIQARLVEVLSGMPFDEFLDKRLFKPLGMKDAGFWVPADKAERLATVHWLKDGKLTPLDGAHGYPKGSWIWEPWTVNSYTVSHKRKGGSYGLVSTAEDYFRFAQMMLNGGELDGLRLLSPPVVHYMTRDHLGLIGRQAPDGRPSGVGFGLGFGVMKDSVAAGDISSEGSSFWGGAAGTFFWIDPEKDLVVVAMTQHMSVPAADALRAQLRTLVYSAMTE